MKYYTLMKVFEVDDMPYPISECASSVRYEFDLGYSTFLVRYGESDTTFPTNEDALSRWLLEQGAEERETILLLYV